MLMRQLSCQQIYCVQVQQELQNKLKLNQSSNKNTLEFEKGWGGGVGGKTLVSLCIAVEVADDKH